MEPQQLNEIMKKIEHDGMQKVKEIQSSNSETTSLSRLPLAKASSRESSDSETTKLSRLPLDQAINQLQNIIADGGKEFEQKMGRPMTYGEMRMMFG